MLFSCDLHSLPAVDFKQMDSALKSYSREVAYKDVSIMAPCYLAEMDLAGAATADNIIFGETTWVSGHKNVAPANVEVSAYEVMDELINYYLDTTKFPALEAVMFAGHSAGGQMTQRYAALKKTSAGEDRLHYWVSANLSLFVFPSSLIVSNRRSPTQVLSCG